MERAVFIYFEMARFVYVYVSADDQVELTDKSFTEGEVKECKSQMK